MPRNAKGYLFSKTKIVSHVWGLVKDICRQQSDQINNPSRVVWTTSFDDTVLLPTFQLCHQLGAMVGGAYQNHTMVVRQVEEPTNKEQANTVHGFF